MAKSLIDTYRQMIEADPASLVFLELARVLNGQGQHAQAAAVCAAGLRHHPGCAEGRVIWGEALLCQGKPAEAMEQFNRAIATDRSDPSTYSLIAAALLRKGLFRSALPLLRKAAALQPGDEDALQALHRAERALGLPLSARPTPQTGKPAEQAATRAAAPSAPPGPTRLARPKPASHPQPPQPAAGRPQRPKAPLVSEGEGDLLEPGWAPAPRGGSDAAQAPPGPRSAAAARHPAESSAEATPPEGTPCWTPHTADTAPAFAVESKAAPEPVGEQQTPEASAARAPEATLSDARGAAPGGAPAEPAAAEAQHPDSPAVLEQDEEGPRASASEAGALLQQAQDAARAALEAAEEAAEAAFFAAAEESAPASPAPTPPPLPRASSPVAALLDAVPEHPQPSAPRRAAPAVSEEVAARIGREYERELQQQLAARTRVSGYARRHARVLAVCAVALLLAAAAWVVLSTRARMLRALDLDTPAGLRQARTLAERVLRVAPFDPLATAVRAFAQAAQFPPEGGLDEAALHRVEARHPGFVLATRALSSPDEARAAAERALVDARELGSGVEAALAHGLAGQILIREGKPAEALERFRSSLAQRPSHAATLVALGRYYASEGEIERALGFFDAARNASPEHVPALVGALQVTLQRDPAADISAGLDKARSALRAEPGWPPQVASELTLLEAKVLALAGKLEEARQVLSSQHSGEGARDADLHAALADLELQAGHFDRAEAALRNALALREGDLGLRERLARAVLAQDRAEEALRLAQDESGARGLATVRGLAHLQLGDVRRARQELASTAREGKVPAEAAIFLAQLDAADAQRALDRARGAAARAARQQRDLARQILERTGRAAPERRAQAQVALGRLLENSGDEAGARAAYTSAMEDPQDWEGACSLGRLHRRAGRLEQAREALQIAVQRNRFHREARWALAETLLGLGEAQSARELLPPAEALTLETRKLLARALLALGELDPAGEQLAAMRAANPRDPELPRLERWERLLRGQGEQRAFELETQALRARRYLPLLLELGAVYEATGNAAAARRAYGRALRLSPGLFEARAGSLSASLPAGTKEALREADQLVAAARGAPQRAQALALSARVRQAAGDLGEAEKLARAAVAESGTHAGAQLSLGLVALAAGKNDLARDALARASVLDPSLSPARLALGRLLARDPKATAAAARELRAYLALAPRGAGAPGAKRMLETLEGEQPNPGAEAK